MKLRFKKAERQKVIRSDSAYSRNFSLALLNWETNRQETRFAFNRFDQNTRRNKKHNEY